MLFFEPRSVLLLLVALGLFALCRDGTQRKFALLVASVLFYAASGIFNLVVLIAFVLINYGVGIRIANSVNQKAEKWLVGIIVLNLANLFSFKYVESLCSKPLLYPCFIASLRTLCGDTRVTFSTL